MMWVIRWTDERTAQDRSMVVEADTKAAAEYMAAKRGIPVVIVEEASRQDIKDAQLNHMLFRGTYQDPSKMTAFGKPIGRLQLVSLMLCGLMTIGLIVRAERTRAATQHKHHTVALAARR